MKTKALVLDLDDTLYAEIDFLYSGYEHIAKCLEPVNWEFLFAQLVERYRAGENAFQFLTEKYQVTLNTLLEWYYNVTNIFILVIILKKILSLQINLGGKRFVYVIKDAIFINKILIFNLNSYRTYIYLNGLSCHSYCNYL